MIHGLKLVDRCIPTEFTRMDGGPGPQVGGSAWFDEQRLQGSGPGRDFTDRELQVLRELISGDPDEEIAARLGMSVWTVRSHIRHMLEKTGFDSRTRLAVVARETGLVIRDY